MSAAKNHIKATAPLPPYDGPGCNQQHATEAALRASQAAGWVGKYVAFDHHDNGKRIRVVGLCVECRPIPRMEPDDIPDFAVVARSLTAEDRTATAHLVANRCQFYDTLKEARKDGLMRLGGGK